eukprot:scaffold7432_cov107-Isochrysis_galbana.AAC.1
MNDEIDDGTRSPVEFLGVRYGPVAAKRIYKVNGVRWRLWKPDFVEALDKVRRDVCGGNAHMMCTFINGGVAAAIAGPNAAQGLSITINTGFLA